MNRAVHSGKTLENAVTKYFHDTLSAKIVKYSAKLSFGDAGCALCDETHEKDRGVLVLQHRLKDVLGTAFIDALFHDAQGNKTYIEIKNQNVRGSVDQKFPLYVENVKERVYDGTLLLIVNKKGVREGVMSYLADRCQHHRFYVVDEENIERVHDIIQHRPPTYCYVGPNAPPVVVPPKCTPIVKWAGGKRAIMQSIISQFPARFGNYFELFAGGISVFLEVCNRGLLGPDRHAFVSDVSFPLINCYNVVKHNLQDLVSALKSDRYANDRTAFDANKARYNVLKHASEQELTLCGGHVELAALFLYLNKTGYNGMYRENKKGLYNIPFGRQQNPTICNEEALSNLHVLLNSKRVALNVGDFRSAELSAFSPGDLVYLDPPYHNTFASYTKDAFTEDDQRALRNFVNELTRKQCLVIVSNSNTDFIRDLYSGFTMIEVTTKRVINSKAELRKDAVSELIIKNF